MAAASLSAARDRRWMPCSTLINKIKVRYGADAVPVTVDSEAYRARHDESLANLAVKLGDKAKKGAAR